ncbi:WD40 repeat domain-containing protein [Tautonia plasticadhaerens]|uniref:WD domain, G-beta repeat n=1 Tax=Tautonia plasticadhaerens TaxID=2527974 RepID=A0A518H9V6_9BACT|nr:WD40 repeat domain-containing protein [Tautonia plasticadhaerens]QDV37634.1 WD domain, G-beta repeat [Tautonia plasticadhaerens]
MRPHPPTADRARPGQRTAGDRPGRLLIAALASLLGCVAVAARPVLGEEPPITALAFSPDGSAVVAASQRGLLVLDWPGLTERATFETASPNPHALAFSPSGNRLAVGGGSPASEGTVEIRAWPGLESLLGASCHDDSVLDLAWRDGRTIVAASLDRSIVLLDVDSGAVVCRLEGHSRGVSSLATLPDEGTLVSVGLDRSLRVWNLDSGGLIHSLDQHTGPVHSVEPRPGGVDPALVATASDDRTDRFWQPSIGRMVRTCRLDSPALDLCWLPDGSRVAACCVDGHVRLIDPTTVEVISDIPALDGWAYAIAVHPTGDGLVVGGPDGRILRIDLRDQSLPPP